MKNPLFSIIIPTYNRGVEIKRCLNSVINQTCKDWEAIIVDNYSIDNTEEIVMSFCDDRIRFFKNHNHGIISVSRNFAIDRANGEWLCFLDSDDSWAPNKLETLIPYLTKYDFIYHSFHCNEILKRPGQSNIHHSYPIKQATVSYLLQRGNPINTSSLAVSSKLVGETRFSEEKKLYAIEDYDFFLQLIDKHPRVLRIKDPLTFYDIDTGVSHKCEEHRYRSRLIYSKWKNWLTKNEYRNVLKNYMLLKGDELYESDPVKARHYYRIMATSPIWYVKKKALKRIIKTYILQFFKIINIYQ